MLSLISEMVTQEDLDFILGYQVQEISKIITNYYLCIDPINSTLIINVPASTDLSKLESQEQLIGMAAYLKLGCKKVRFYCYQTWLWDYNAHISVEQVDNMTSAVLSPSPTETENESSYFEQPQVQAIQAQPQSAIDWISFNGIAQSLGVAPDTVCQEVEDYGIFVTLHRNLLGLSGDNLEAYLNRRHTQMLEQFRAMLARENAASTPKPKAGTATLKAVPDAKPSNNGFVPTADGGLTLPDGFSIMEGRTRKPPVMTALKIAVDALPDGKDAETRKMYIRQIAMRENVENFLGALAAQFEGSQKFKSVAMTSKEICNAARELWDEYAVPTSA